MEITILLLVIIHYYVAQLELEIQHLEKMLCKKILQQITYTGIGLDCLHNNTAGTENTAGGANALDATSVLGNSNSALGFAATNY